MAVKMRKACPKCGCREFAVSSVLVAQDWLVNENGDLIKCTNPKADILHVADDADDWVCAECGYCARGREFNIPPDKVISEAFDQIIKIASSVADISKDAEDIKNYATNMWNKMNRDLHYSNTLVLTNFGDIKDIFDSFDRMLSFRFLKDFDKKETLREYNASYHTTYGENKLIVSVRPEGDTIKVVIGAIGEVVYDLERRIPTNQNTHTSVFDGAEVCLQQSETIYEVAFSHFV